ncbi:hypothetical protein ElyMa_004776200 [Elysia marginata]|uniref:Uncharacterized protein n=1 Tax=Elysia marginata TaxID=1093978 RepID=A0AAV4IE60_9GAST|nr:hypothetical protein ElyMa_004776200 [Elysia marginata]
MYAHQEIFTKKHKGIEATQRRTRSKNGHDGAIEIEAVPDDAPEEGEKHCISPLPTEFKALHCTVAPLNTHQSARAAILVSADGARDTGTGSLWRADDVDLTVADFICSATNLGILGVKKWAVRSQDG